MKSLERARRRSAERRRPVRKGQEGFGLIELLIAITILAIGLMAVAGIALAVASQTRLATYQTDQALAAQEVLERMQAKGYASATDTTENLSFGNRSYTVTVTVTQPSSRVKEVAAQVSGIGPLNSRTFTTRLYQPRQLPAAP